MRIALALRMSLDFELRLAIHWCSQSRNVQILLEYGKEEDVRGSGIALTSSDPAACLRANSTDWAAAVSRPATGIETRHRGGGRGAFRTNRRTLCRSLEGTVKIVEANPRIGMAA